MQRPLRARAAVPAGRMAAGLQATPGLGLLRTSKGAEALPRPRPHRGNWPAPSGWPALTRSWGPGGELGPRHGGAPAGRSATGALVCLKRPQARTAADWPMGRPASSHVYPSYSAPCPAGPPGVRRSWRSPSRPSATSPRPPRSWPPATSGRIPSLSLVVLLVILKSGRILFWAVSVSTEQGMRAFETPMKSTRDQPSEGRQLAHPHHCRLCAKLHTHP